MNGICASGFSHPKKNTLKTDIQNQYRSYCELIAPDSRAAAW
jgi:hypothetical protein